MSKYIGTFLMHTDKAIKKVAEPKDRIIAVVGTVDGYLLGWKHYLDPKDNTKVVHAGLQESMELSDTRLFLNGKQPNGSEPTAMFKKDSFYETFDLQRMQMRNAT